MFFHARCMKPGLGHYLRWTLALFLLITTTACQPETVKYRTSGTHCTITFSQTTTNDTVELVFEKCEMQICRKYGLRGGCRTEDTYRLQEKNCYWECCHSHSYDWRQCEDFNQDFSVRERSSNRNVIIALSISLAILLVAVIVFAVNYMQCCKGSEEELHKLHENGGGKQAEWKRLVKQFKIDEEECKLCGRKEAFVMHSCGALYHLKCLPEIAEKWECAHCVRPIRKMRVHCVVCLTYYITLNAESFTGLELGVLECYQHHPERECFQFMAVELDTERKLTETTKG